MKINTLTGSPKQKIYSKEDVYLFATVGKTFYVVKGSDRIVSFREWHQMGRPAFDKSGEYSVCSSYLEKKKRG